MAGLVLADDLENAGEPGVIADNPLAQKGLHLPVAALFGERDHAAKAFEKVIARDDRLGIQLRDGRLEHDLDKTINVSKCAVYRQRHDTAQLEPAAEHQIMLTLVTPVLFDQPDHRNIVWRAGACR